MDDIFSPHKGGVYTSAKPSWTLPTSTTTINETALPVSNNTFDIFSAHHGGVVKPLTTPDGKPLSKLMTVNGKALPASIYPISHNGKALNSNNLESTESMDKPKVWINIPVLLIGGLLVALLITKK
jgi:hypothetical protein